MLAELALAKEKNVLVFRHVSKSFEMSESEWSELKAFFIAALHKGSRMPQCLFFVFKVPKEICIRGKLRDILIDEFFF